MVESFSQWSNTISTCINRKLAPWEKLSEMICRTLTRFWHQVRRSVFRAYQFAPQCFRVSHCPLPLREAVPVRSRQAGPQDQNTDWFDLGSKIPKSVSGVWAWSGEIGKKAFYKLSAGHQSKWKSLKSTPFQVVDTGASVHSNVIDMFSLAYQRYSKIPDLSSSQNERLHLQCGLTKLDQTWSN